MAKKKEKEVEVEETAAPAEEKADEAKGEMTTPEAAEPKTKGKKAKVEGDSVTVKFRDHAGNPTERVFSLADHGENFADIAEQFKAKHASRIIA